MARPTLGLLAGVSQQHLSGFEQGLRNPTLVTLHELAQTPRVSHANLVDPNEGGEGEPSGPWT